MRNTIIDLFDNSVAKYGENIFLLEKSDGEFRPSTYNQCYKDVLNIGAGLTKLGLKPKDRVSILSEGRNYWILSELGMLYSGAVSVPLSIKLEESNDLLFRLNHAEVSMIMVSGTQLSKIRRIKDQLPDLKHIILFDSVEELEEGEILIEQVIKLGAEYLIENKETYLAIGQAISNDDYATITYTSGTTGNPKGVILTHRNYTANIDQALTCMTIPSYYRTLIILPLDHCFAHVVGFYIMIKCGASVATVQSGATPMETLKNIPLNIKEVKPHFLLSVPALAKNFRKNIESSIEAKGRFTKLLFNIALKIAYIYNKDGYNKGYSASTLLKPIVNLFDKILFSKIREAFGGELKFFVGGGALLDIDLQRFYCAIGTPMCQGYGLSEATPIISANTPKKHKFGSSGILVTPLEVKIDDNGIVQPIGEQGEIVIKGENVMAGYWKNEAATLETIKDGWLYTGDLGYISKEGFLYVAGRFKSLLISSDGEKYSPEGMEESIVSQSPYIDQIVIYNNQSPYTTALIVPNIDAITKKIDQNSKEQEAIAYEAIKLIKLELKKYKSGGEFAGSFPSRWLPSTFALIEEPFSEKNGLVNSTMKLIRGKIEERYKSRIESMYSAKDKDIFNSKNMSVFMSGASQSI